MRRRRDDTVVAWGPSVAGRFTVVASCRGDRRGRGTDLVAAEPYLVSPCVRATLPDVACGQDLLTLAMIAAAATANAAFIRVGLWETSAYA